MTRLCADIMRSTNPGHASGVRKPRIYVGAPPGEDGIHRASWRGWFRCTALKRDPTVQVGESVPEKLLLEGVPELMKRGSVVGARIWSRGLTSSSVNGGAQVPPSASPGCGACRERQ